MKKGIFITLYGINNIGKTSHALRLVARLKKMSIPAMYLKYPVYKQKPTGPLLNKMLRSQKKQGISEAELQLWFVLNRYQFQPKLKKLLDQKKVIIAEDYIGTGIAWGLTKGAKFRELENMNKFLVQPDLSILIDGKRILRAKERKHIHERDDKLVRKCQRVFRRLAKRYKWNVVQLADDRDITAARIWNSIKNSFDY